jgi:hypothetical protein
MIQDIRIQQLAAKLEQLEQELHDAREELATLSQQPATEPTEQLSVPAIRWADKALLQREFDRLFEMLGIEDRPVDIYDLQRRMGEAGLEPNELSRGIVEARDE